MAILEPQERFSDIKKKIDKLGIPNQKLGKLRSVKRLRSTSDQYSLFYFVCAFLLGAFSVVFGSSIYFRLYTKEGFSKIWFYVEGIDPEAESCTVDMPAAIHDAFRPPVNCSMCSHVTEVEHVSVLTAKLFEERHAYSGRPVVIVDGTNNWTAPEVFSFNFFKQLYPEDSPVRGDQCQFFPYQTSFESLNEVFNMTEDRANLRDGSNPWYIGWSNCDQEATDVLRRHYKRPYFLPPQSESSKTDWIFMGSPGYGAHMHIDHVGNPSWQAQIKGQKLWTLEPPPECFLECQTLKVIVNPGEIIVLDTNRWFHKTLVLGDSISITIGSEYD
ncbi:Bifunctional arginine demethylase and lysyl-hydroxylase JMJD6 [Nymphon striatum]|nr:Bifunctional arginine demethylase and lysyl-hydroxylase JMJD6 [Nymphon striatum]